MSRLLPGLRRSLMVSTPIVLSTPLLVRKLHRPILCDAPDPLARVTGARHTGGQGPVMLQSGVIDSKTVRQISMGSVLGVVGGLGVGVFSKPLAVLIGLGLVLVQLLESRGIHIVPYSYLQQRLKQTNVRSLIQSNPTFKISFGITFALAAFAHF